MLGVKLVRGRVGHGPSWLGAEFVRGRDVQLPSHLSSTTSVKEVICRLIHQFFRHLVSSWACSKKNAFDKAPHMEKAITQIRSHRTTDYFDDRLNVVSPNKTGLANKQSSPTLSLQNRLAIRRKK